eukprot:TRINITY_DN5060_c0_g1_i1.p1 TRINITY_DN5060_c0_g1~~TRINITY_DN5060_c0_g1_i1.p1  ORF type:complete len:502 (+),score=136.67 TRINITY_DN5060_c0_g1_i1:54-1508(+)
MAVSKVLLLLACTIGAVLASPGPGPLFDYVNTPDDTYSWKHISTISGNYGYTGYVLNVTTQTWMDAKNSSNPVWWHYVVVCVPDQIDYSIADTAFMYIDGGSMTDSPPTELWFVISYICLESSNVAVHLLQIPNEPIEFADHRQRSEDALIAYTWSHFINETNAPIWLARLPMTKSAVRAMDAVQEFVPTLGRNLNITNFVVAGASKRGWTTWTTGIVDQPRVRAIAPIVMPILNMVPNLNHHFQAYGGWSFALSDYLDMHLMSYLNDPVFLKMTAVIDPFSYLDFLKLPKFLIASTGDEFFVPDSTQYFLQNLTGETHLFLAPNAEHSLATGIFDVMQTMHTWYHMLLKGVERPTYSHTLVKSNSTASITMQTTTQPTKVLMWHARTLPNDKLRDFRLVVCYQLPQCLQPVLWKPEPVTGTQKNGVWTYTATYDAPASGWVGFLLETYWEQPGLDDLRVTSELNVVPDVMPFPPCGNNCQPSK